MTDGGLEQYAGLKGKIMRAPLGDVVKVLEVEPYLYFGETSCLTENVEDRPNGYKAGSIGRYLARELTETHGPNESNR